MAAERQRQRAAEHDEQFQHASIEAGVVANINGDGFWRGSGWKQSATSWQRLGLTEFSRRPFP
jgi:hypothetical protein